MMGPMSVEGPRGAPCCICGKISEYGVMLYERWCCFRCSALPRATVFIVQGVPYGVPQAEPALLPRQLRRWELVTTTARAEGVALVWRCAVVEEA